MPTTSNSPKDTGTAEVRLAEDKARAEKDLAAKQNLTESDKHNGETAQEKARRERFERFEREDGGSVETDKDRNPQTYTADERLRDQANGEISSVREDDMIVHRVNVPDGQGGIKVVEHGPMKTSEWAEYSRKHGL